MDRKTTGKRAAVIATALITLSLGATACGSGSGSSGGGGVYVAQESGRDVLVIRGASVSMASAYTSKHGDSCAHYNATLEAAEGGDLRPEHDEIDGFPSYEDVRLGTMNEASTSVLWSPESEDDGEVVSIALDTPLEGLVTIDGEIYVPLDSDQGQSLVAEQRSQHCS